MNISSYFRISWLNWVECGTEDFKVVPLIENQ